MHWKLRANTRACSFFFGFILGTHLAMLFLLMRYMVVNVCPHVDMSLDIDTTRLLLRHSDEWTTFDKGSWFPSPSNCSWLYRRTVRQVFAKDSRSTPRVKFVLPTSGLQDSPTLGKEDIHTFLFFSFTLSL